jgi:uncharacterized protein YyaL (SSP411 family)
MKVVINTNDDIERSDLPLLEGRSAIDGGPTVYVCENFVCRRPVASADELRRELM